MQGKTIALRIVSVVLVVICMGAIFMFSAEDAAKSDSTSKGTIIALAGVIKKDFNKMSQQQRDEYVADLNGAVRTAAHFSVYCLLGLLVALCFFVQAVETGGFFCRHIPFVCDKRRDTSVFCSGKSLRAYRRYS